ncbi:CP family cyanate transporter-like MFS transporter [Marihabitans asiaticum]|uniref:CP family cyanate transporter-like MFS transporter n=1 Tax=Marihabitans asiaticum TaxID=415218 RepID=A0A560WGI1_9MICO|nr:CP family cyanate transporter-like MFS transporter [Marihabitans asiaticum]
MRGSAAEAARTIAPLILVAAALLVSLNLRPGASSVGPVLDELRTGLSMPGGLAGALTGLPGLCFGVGGALAVRLGRRAGLSGGITIGLLLATAGLLARPFVAGPSAFLALSAVALLGMAVGNILVPAWIKTCRGIEVRLMTIYGSGLIVGGSLGSLLTAPIAAASGWRWSLGLWGLGAAAAAALWWWIARTERRRTPASPPSQAAPSGRIARSPTAIAMTALFALQSMHAYIQMGWLPQIYRDAGLSASLAGAMQALLAAVTIVGGLTMPTVIACGRGLAPMMLGLGALLATGYGGLLLAPAALPWLWAVLLGISGFAFPLVIALITARTRSHEVTAQLSGFVQPVGYLLAALGPVLVGVIHAATGGWEVVLWILVATAVPFTLAGLRAVRPAVVDDEI